MPSFLDVIGSDQDRCGGVWGKRFILPAAIYFKKVTEVSYVDIIYKVQILKERRDLLCTINKVLKILQAHLAES